MNEYDYQPWYQMLDKPSFAPPEWAFGIAWGIIYPLILISFIYTLYLWKKGRLDKNVILIYFLNLLANFAFTPILLGTKNNILVFVDILIVLGTLACLEWEFFKKSKINFLLLLPYLLWGSFATVLQLTITLMNL